MNFELSIECVSFTAAGAEAAEGALRLEPWGGEL